MRVLLLILALCTNAYAMDFTAYDKCHEDNQKQILAQNLLITASIGNLLDLLAVTALTEATMDQEDCYKYLTKEK